MKKRRRGCDSAAERVASVYPSQSVCSFIVLLPEITLCSGCFPFLLFFCGGGHELYVKVLLRTLGRGGGGAMLWGGGV